MARTLDQKNCLTPTLFVSALLLLLRPFFFPFLPVASSAAELRLSRPITT